MADPSFDDVSKAMTKAPAKGATTVSRKDLFHQVWDKPMSRLAQEYGLSGNGLAKVCDRLNVPYPPRGYWAKKAAGKKVVRYRLPEPEEDTPLRVTITPTPPVPPPLEVPPEIRQRVEAEKASAAAMIVLAHLHRPHPVVAAWLAERDQQLKQARRERDPWLQGTGPPDWTESERRQHRILDTLFKAAERNAVKVRQPDRFTLFFEVSGERVDYKLRDKHKQVRTPKTRNEVRRLPPGERAWDQKLQPTGVLTFSIVTHVAGLPKQTWTDTAGKLLEAQLDDVLTGLLLAGPLLVAQRHRREEEERRTREENHKRYLAAQCKKLDDNRWRRFVELAGRWTQAEEVRQFLLALERHPDAAACLADGSSVADLLEWARDHLAAYDPMTDGPGGVFEEVLTVTAWTYRD